MRDIAPAGLIVTTGSQQGLDLLGKTRIGPGDKVIVKGPTFRPPSSAFVYGADLVSTPIDADGVRTAPG